MTHMSAEAPGRVRWPPAASWPSPDRRRALALHRGHDQAARERPATLPAEQRAMVIRREMPATSRGTQAEPCRTRRSARFDRSRRPNECRSRRSDSSRRSPDSIACSRGGTCCRSRGTRRSRRRSGRPRPPARRRDGHRAAMPAISKRIGCRSTPRKSAISGAGAAERSTARPLAIATWRRPAPASRVVHDHADDPVARPSRFRLGDRRRHAAEIDPRRRVDPVGHRKPTEPLGGMSHRVARRTGTVPAAARLQIFPRDRPHRAHRRAVPSGHGPGVGSRAVSRIDLVRDAATLDVPVHLFAGRGDRITPLEIIEQWHALRGVRRAAPGELRPAADAKTEKGRQRINRPAGAASPARPTRRCGARRRAWSHAARRDHRRSPTNARRRDATRRRALGDGTTPHGRGSPCR